MGTVLGFLIRRFLPIKCRGESSISRRYQGLCGSYRRRTVCV